MTLVMLWGCDQKQETSHASMTQGMIQWQHFSAMQMADDRSDLSSLPMVDHQAFLLDMLTMQMLTVQRVAKVVRSKWAISCTVMHC